MIKTLTSDLFRINTNNLDLNCAVYGLQTCFYTPIKVRVTRITYSHSVTKPVNMTHCKWWNSCIDIRHSSYLF